MKGTVFILFIFLCQTTSADPLDIAGVDSIELFYPKTYLPLKDPQPQGDFEKMLIPLKRVGNIYLIEAKVDGVIGNFVLDLGAPYLVLNSTYFRDYKVLREYRSGTLTSENSFIRRTSVKRFEFEEVFFENIEADITDLARIENKRGVKILGLMGVNLFKSFVFELDMRSNQLVLYKTVPVEHQEEDLILETDLSIQNDVLLIRSEINGKKLKFSLDTGAEVNIVDSRLPGRIFDGMKISRKTTVSGASGQTAEVLLVSMGKMKIGEVEFDGMRTLVLNLNTMSRAYGLGIDGMLGYSFFSRGKVVLDFRNGKLKMYSNGN
ncbi:MAG TPA: hypothetical protein DDX92_13445 [Flavobacteriales bacterium]|jgi:predicted aspartyl protease|nr:hypothetical protein [Flavobacteriales bacterium]